MLHRLFSIIQTVDDLRHEDYKERIKARNKKRLIIIGVLLAIVIAGCLFVRIIT